MPSEIINKVEESGLITFDLETLYPKGERVLFDIKDLLFQGLILREKDFREYVKNEGWAKYKDKYIALICSADAIVPTWAYMLITVQLEQHCKRIVFGNLELLEIILFQDALSKLNLNDYKDARILIKGCGKLPVPEYAYIEITRLLRPVAKSIMYGEACSTVPLYKASLQ